jgi:anti-sigma factor RsiW
MELACQLAPVAAPESLWDRIHEPPVPRRSKPVHWALLPIAAALMLIASGGVAWRIGLAPGPGVEMARLAEHELGVSTLDLLSNDPMEIRRWVKAQVNVDIELPAGASAVRLLGARWMRFKGTPVAAIAYRVGDAAALLVIRKGSAATSRHLFSRVESAGSARLFAWSMHRQDYAIAFAGTRDPHGACLLCHAN